MKEFINKHLHSQRSVAGRTRLVLTLVFSLLVFVGMLITLTIAIATIIFLYDRGILDFEAVRENGLGMPFLILAFISIGVGLIISLLVGWLPMRPLREIIRGLQSLSEGDYQTRIDMGRLPMGAAITESFNTLAHELEHTEMFRADFINNFSHEFKTPIVSILGFAKLLKQGDLTLEQQEEYLDIIEEESTRLSTMATNVLNLTKVEDQEILTDITEFNLSEQIRDCVLLLEKQWSAKNLTPDLEFNEYQISASEELLRQVWINLLDNAIKYSPEGGTFEVTIRRKDENYQVDFRNFGPPIAEQDQSMIMKKFYQADTSHASEGNGIGLAIVDRIVKLHRGSVIVKSSEEDTTFSVMLPAAQ